MEEIIFKKCGNCGTLVKVMINSKEELEKICSKDDTKIIKPNTEDASFEKHVPNFVINGNKIDVKINHPMDEDHYIMFITMKTENEETTKYLRPGDLAEASFEYKGKGIIYAYCNKHSLWSKEID